MRRLNNAALVAAFLVAISVPLAVNLAGHDGGDPVDENRQLAAFPRLEPSWQAVSAFAPSLDLWFQDHFGLKSTLVRWYGVTRYFWLRMSPSPAVVRGKNGWLFYAEDGGLDDFAHDQPLWPEEVANWRESIVRAKAWCRARGIGYLFTVVPDKHVLYPEYFDDHVTPVGPVSRTDQLLTATFDTGVVVDVRPAMRAAKAGDRLYHMTDTHWNERGAFVAYQQIIAAVRAQLPAVPPAKDRSMFEARTRTLEGRDLARIIGLRQMLWEEDLRLVPKQPHDYKVLEPAGGYATSGEGRIVTEIPGSSLPRALVYRDSFTSLLAPLLSEHFSRVVYLWQNDFLPNQVEAERPDIVIQQMVGRHLQWFVPTPELIPRP